MIILIIIIYVQQLVVTLSDISNSMKPYTSAFHPYADYNINSISYIEYNFC